jgi:hypothetical protein
LVSSSYMVSEAVEFIIKLTTAVIYGFRNELVLVPGKPFQPSLLFVGKVRAYLRVEHLKGDSLG